MRGPPPLAELALVGAPPRAHLRERLRPRLGEIVPGLHPIAEDLLGADARIDFVGVEPTGRVVLVLLVEPGEDLAAIGEAVAQRAWVEPRVRDWIQLAPAIPARSGAGVRVVLLGTEFSARARAAAEALGPNAVALARYRCVRNGSDLHVLLEAPSPLRSPPGPVARAPAPPPAELPPFRTGLTDEDLGLSAEEQRSLE